MTVSIQHSINILDRNKVLFNHEDNKQQNHNQTEEGIHGRQQQQ